VVLVDAGGHGHRIRGHTRASGPIATPSSSYARAIEGCCRRFGWGYARARTDAPFEDLVLRVLREQDAAMMQQPAGFVFPDIR
jgi:hypothetical protein